MKSAILSAALLLLPALASAQVSSNEEFTCHGDSTKQSIVMTLLKGVSAEYGADTMDDLLIRMNPVFDLILVKGRNSETGELTCSARMTVSMEQINLKTVRENLAQATVNQALLAAAGQPVEQDVFLSPSGFGDGTAYWDDVVYSIQPTSDGVDHVISIQNGEGYRGWFKLVVKHGGLDITDEEIEITKSKNERWEKAYEETKQPAQPSQIDATPAAPITPSFDCAKASSTNEKLICSDAELSTLDTEVAAIYKEAKAKTADPASFKKSSVDAWKWREANCHDKACLLEWYTKRKASLSSPAP